MSKDIKEMDIEEKYYKCIKPFKFEYWKDNLDDGVMNIKPGTCFCSNIHDEAECDNCIRITHNMRKSTRWLEIDEDDLKEYFIEITREEYDKDEKRRRVI